MRDKIVIDFFKDHDLRIRATMKTGLETAIDLAIFKDLIFEKKILTRDEYQKKVEEKTKILFGQTIQDVKVEPMSADDKIETVEIKQKPESKVEKKENG